MSERNTYVLSINGLIGDLPYELDEIQFNPDTGDHSPVFGQVTHRHKNVVIDAGDIHISGSSGDTILTMMQNLDNAMRPLTLSSIEGYPEDFLMSVGSGIPFDPTE